MKKLQLHHSLSSRREFLGAGLISSLGYLAMPTVLDTLLRSTRAEAAGTASMPFLIFDGAGGFGMPSIFLPGGPGGPLADRLTNYSALGYSSAAVDIANTDTTRGPAFDLRMGVPVQTGSFLTALLAPITAAGANPASLKLMTICHTGQDDSSGNRQSAMVSISQVVASQAKFINTGLGTRAGASGTNSSVPNPTPALTPLNVQSVGDVLGAVGLSGSLGALTTGAQGAWASLISSLSAREAAKLGELYGGQTFADLVKSGNQKNAGFVSGSSVGLDPRANATVAGVYGINANSNVRDAQVIKATLAMNALLGNSGPAAYVIGGCDYHDNRSASKDQKDAEIGQAIGEAVATAFRLNQKFMFQIITDGGVDMRLGSSDTGGIAATGDNGTKSMTVLGYYDPAVTDGSHYVKGNAQNPQLGFYTANGAVSSTNVGGGNAIVAAAVVANYLNALGRIGEMASFSPVANLSPAQIDALLVFG